MADKIIFMIGLTIGTVIRTMARKEQNRASRSADLSMTKLEAVLLSLNFFGLLVIPLVYIFTPWLDWANYALPFWAGWLGAAFFAAAIWLLWRSHADLGKNWTVTPNIREEHKLVTRGVYRYIRHPMYAAHWLWGIAQVLLLQNWIAGLSMLASFALLYALRVPREEEMMLAHFGDEYRAYMQQTGRVLPRSAR
jgi:protein-S-isoprenylcysteine O-methyltransferase Ste14